jgi:uncharacterized membrane protein (DUF485 family)
MTIILIEQNRSEKLKYDNTNDKKQNKRRAFAFSFTVASYALFFQLLIIGPYFTKYVAICKKFYPHK